ncbi:MAG: SxtJ family membrane protein [Alphaproteobacteria bacterium]
MSTHEDFDRKHEARISSDRAFGLVFAGALAAVGLWPVLDGNGARWWALGLAFVLLAAALSGPAWLGPANRLWARFGLALHRVVNPLITGLVFYLVVTPTGLALRALGKDPLRLRLDTSAKSYWIERRPPGPAPDTMKRQF